jgi:transposase
MVRRRSRLKEDQVERLLACFVDGTPARPAARIAGVNRHTARLYYHRLRETIAGRIDRSALHGGAFGAAGLGADDADPAARPPGTPGATPLFGVLERGGQIRIVPIDDRPATPDPHGALPFDAIVLAHDLSSRAGAPRALHRRPGIVLHEQVGRDPVRRKAIRVFWNRTLRHLSRFNGVPARHLYLYLKECEWRFGTQADEPPLRTLRSWVRDAC